ncbi:MAG TPA: twin-arginine translocase subunit TatC [Kineosporiaceae bacterium]|jgi:sec-independent protein translocase protein TatC|nr:twin-arginine translocase subunit TatC [Kineosporiaceae bacterium]
MPLREHLRELRQRILKAGLAIVLGAVGGWFLYDPVYTALQHPIIVLRGERPGSTITLNIAGVATSFNLQLRMAFYIGIVLSSPVWLYQLWAFIVPGLTKRERRRAMGFAASGVPLFLAGLGLAWLVLPNAVRFLTNFTPQGTANIIDASEYLAFVTQIMLAFGIAFVVPLLLVALNMAGVVSALTLAKGWRVAVFLCFLFSAVASPTPDAGSMLALAFPMVGLYMIAVGIAWVTDRRRARRNALEGFGALDDDEASPLAPDDAFDPHAAYDDAPGVDAGDSPHRP